MTNQIALFLKLDSKGEKGSGQVMCSNLFWSQPEVEWQWNAIICAQLI